MVVVLLIVIIVILLVGAAKIRGCAIQIGVLAVAAVLLVEVKRRLAWVPEAAWWIGGIFTLLILAGVMARYERLAKEQEKAKRARRVKSLDEAIERERANKRPRA